VAEVRASQPSVQNHMGILLKYSCGSAGEWCGSNRVPRRAVPQVIGVAS
jgi:hypothetical protein